MSRSEASCSGADQKQSLPSITPEDVKSVGQVHHFYQVFEK